jgi:hypothetical protein
MIKIKRNSGYADKLRAYQINVDGKIIGEIKDGQKIEIAIPKGQHKMYLKIDWCRSNSIDFELGDEIIEFECGSNLTGIKLLFSFIYVLLFRNDYIWLKRM